MTHSVIALPRSRAGSQISQSGRFTPPTQPALTPDPDRAHALGTGGGNQAPALDLHPAVSLGVALRYLATSRAGLKVRARVPRLVFSRAL